MGWMVIDIRGARMRILKEFTFGFGERRVRFLGGGAGWKRVECGKL